MRCLLPTMTFVVLASAPNESLCQQDLWTSVNREPAYRENAMLGRWNKGELSTKATGFEENKGQVVTTDGQPASFVRYSLTQGNTNIFLLPNGIAYQFRRTHLPAGYTELLKDVGLHPERSEQLGALRKDVRIETFRMDMTLEDADPHALITTEGGSNDYTNYYNRSGSGPEHAPLDVRTYSNVTYHDVYPGIDWVIHTTAQGMKYDFVVRPGADPALIRLRFKDQEELHVDKDGNLIHGNRMGRFTEERPVSFQDGQVVPTAFVLQDDILRFELGTYDRSRTLIIDPARIWGTYCGWNATEYSYSCAVDGSGNVYLAGYTYSTTAIGSGGHQNTFGGNTDAFLVKYDANGTRLWATLYGGSGSEQGGYCAVDGSGNVYLTGNSDSESGIAFNGHQNTKGAGMDAFLVKFSPAGTRLWGTYYGGDSQDYSLFCDTDGSGNVYIAGFTDSATGIASFAHQPTYAGNYDAMLVKFDATGALLWGTYYGGDSGEIGRFCAVDANGEVYLSGETTSANGIAFNGHQNMPLSGNDPFLVKFDQYGNRQWGTYYGGSGDEYGSSCAADGSGNVYLAGTTGATTGIASGGHQNAFGGGDEAFLVKFNTSGVRQWGTYYGGTGDEFGRFCTVDGNNNVYLSGFTGSSAAIASNGYQNTYSGGADAFMVKFNASGVRQWGTYYGGDEFEDGFSCATDAIGNVFLAGITASTNGIAANGHQNVYAGSIDAFLVKLTGTGCTASVTLELRPDAASDQVYWEIVEQYTEVVLCSGGPYFSGITNPITEACCLADGCYRLRVFDAGGDGFVSSGFVGGYQLRESTGAQRRYIDNPSNYTDLVGGPPDVSAIASNLDNGAFCVPMGNDRPIFPHCDKLDWVANGSSYLVATENTNVSATWVVGGANTVQPANNGYEFWWFDPNGTYSYRRFRPHNKSDGHSPANARRACHVKINGWSNTVLTPHLLPYVLYNIRIRGVYGTIPTYASFGPACLFKIDPFRANCPRVKLQDNPANIADFSCGVTRTFGGPNSAANRIIATPPQFYAGQPTAPCVRYQFRFRNVAENVCIIRPIQASPVLYLNWTTPPFLCATQDYDVDVRVSRDCGFTWCVDGPTPNCTEPVTPWGKVCRIHISSSTVACLQNGGGNSLALQDTPGAVTMYPNPNRGDQLFLELTNISTDVSTATFDIFSLAGQRVSTRVVPVQDGLLKTVLDLQGSLASGLYMVQLTAGTRVFNERLVIQP